MTQSAPYQEMEERLRRQRSVRLYKDRLLNQKAQESREKLQAQKGEKLSKTATKAAVQERTLAEEEKNKTDALVAKHTEELEQVRQRHISELAERKEGEKRAIDALADKNSTERKKLEDAFKKEELAIEFDLLDGRQKLQLANKAEDEQFKKFKNDMYDVALRRTQPAEQAGTDALPAISPDGGDKDCWAQRAKKYLNGTAAQVTASGRSVSISRLQQRTAGHSPKPNISDPKDTGTKILSDVQVSGEKRKFEDNKAHQARRGSLESSAKNGLAETSINKRPKIAPPRTNLDPRKYFEVSRLRLLKPSGRGLDRSVVSELRKHTNERLYLDIGIEIYRPVLLQGGKQLPGTAASWYIDRSDIDRVQWHEGHDLACIRMKAGHAWVKFKDAKILDTFINVLNERWPSTETSRFSDIVDSTARIMIPD
ncbi:hypothetical protein DL95DRAFT_407170 [Leptodontidium sp. 2 PMI_412]|nr:hypothetical protein DL95DRAFT_407170 [Leptodontidium sp. 2 PMI_412]